MCMRCGKRTAPRRGEEGCTCRAEKAACVASGLHGTEVEERKDAIFPTFVHRLCKRCGFRV